MSNPAKSIRIGTMIAATGGEAAKRIDEIADLGFESFEPFFWQTTMSWFGTVSGPGCKRWPTWKWSAKQQTAAMP